MESGEGSEGRSHRAILDALSLLSGKWEPVIILQLRTHGRLGFNELLDTIPDVSGKVLSEALESLEAAGVIERHVVSDAPLRVQYERTPAGRNLDSLFKAASDWGESHLDSARPTVLVAGADRRQTEMFEQWLATHYTVKRANHAGELDSKLADSTDVSVVSDDLPGKAQRALFERVRTHSRTVCILQDKPGVENLDIPCDDLLRTPVVPKRLLEAVDRQLSKRGESKEERESSALVAKQSMIETGLPDGMSEAELAVRAKRFESGVTSDDSE
jgi:DNA-binding HxlR family transcriptional regulator